MIQSEYFCVHIKEKLYSTVSSLQCQYIVHIHDQGCFFFGIFLDFEQFWTLVVYGFLGFHQNFKGLGIGTRWGRVTFKFLGEPFKIFNVLLNEEVISDSLRALIKMFSMNCLFNEDNNLTLISYECSMGLMYARHCISPKERFIYFWFVYKAHILTQVHFHAWVSQHAFL